MEGLRIKVLGGIQVQRGGETIEFSRHKAAALLVYLAVTGERQSRDALATLFWPENTQARAYANLRQAIWEIRRSIGDKWLEVTRESLQMIPRDDLWLDIVEFHDLISKVKNHVHPRGMICEDCLADYEQAAALFNGDFLAGFSLRDCPEFDDWQYFQTVELHREIGGIYNQLVDWLSEKQEYDQAIFYARHWLQSDELNENAHRALMRLYSAKGQRNAAIQQYQSCVQLIEHQLNITPEPITTELYQIIQSGSFTIKSEHSGAQPLPGSKLPAQVTPFIGRSDEIAELSRLLLAADTRLLTILAPGGMGKSRLAIEIA